MNSGSLVLNGVPKAQILGIASGHGDRGGEACGQMPWEGKGHRQQELPLGVLGRALAEAEGRAVRALVLSLEPSLAL